MVERLFLAVPRGCLSFVIVVVPDHTHLLLLLYQTRRKNPLLQTYTCFYMRRAELAPVVKSKNIFTDIVFKTLLNEWHVIMSY